MGSFGWPTEMVEVKARSSCEESVSVSGSSIVLQDAPKPQGSDSVSGGGRSVLMDSTLQMMGYGLSSSTNMDWSQQALLNRSSTGRTESNFHCMLQEDLSSRQNFRQEPRVESVHQTNQGFSSTDQHHSSSSCESTVTCQGLPASFPLDSTSSVSYGYPSTLLQGLLDQSDLQTHQQSPYENRPMNYPPNYGMITNDLSPSWPRFPQLLKTSSPPKHQQIASHQLHFSNNAPYWNASAAAPNTNIRSTFYPSSQAQLLTPTFEGKPNCSSNLSLKPKTEEVRDSSSVVKKSSSEPATKRPRVDTPSPLPTFKVRKEKLGDRITALQQLVSPFGKTDTASVLFEAIEYIKFLHEQVSALSAPYMKNGAVIQQQQQSSDKSKDGEGPQQDLRSRGLCLVPVSSTFPVTNETTADFWTPTFGGTYR